MEDTDKLCSLEMATMAHGKNGHFTWMQETLE